MWGRKCANKCENNTQFKIYGNVDEQRKTPEPGAMPNFQRETISRRKSIGATMRNSIYSKKSVFNFEANNFSSFHPPLSLVPLSIGAQR